jgi:predicted short-subunit dehydrogenase-like oxidoreductase (DUF2520 family)
MYLIQLNIKKLAGRSITQTINRTNIFWTFNKQNLKPSSTIDCFSLLSYLNSLFLQKIVTMMLSINILGCGKLGQTLGKLFELTHTATLKAIVNQSLSSSKEAATFLNPEMALLSLDELPSADIYLITSTDNTIQQICEQLTKKKTLNKNAIVIHCCGSLSSDILLSAKKIGCLIASVHPVKSFAHPKTVMTNFKGTICTFEGDEAALPIITQLFNGIGGSILKIKKENKKLYHAALTMANNYLVTLHYHAMQNLMIAGLEELTAKKLATQMMYDAYQHLETLDHKHALTGPIQRGDIKVVEGHLEALNHDSLAQRIYSSLGAGTLPLTMYSEEKKEEFITLFNKS